MEQKIRESWRESQQLQYEFLINQEDQSGVNLSSSLNLTGIDNIEGEWSRQITDLP